MTTLGELEGVLDEVLKECKAEYETPSEDTPYNREVVKLLIYYLRKIQGL
jgi:hypothetical protein